MNNVAEQTILVADDDEHILELVSLYLRRAGYGVITAKDGDEALAREKDHRPDLLILDVMMPGQDGLQVARQLRQKGDVPIVLLTARGSDIDKIAGLRLGADDYVTKPFNPEELVARVEAVLRRAGGRERVTGARTVAAGDITIDLEARTALAAGQPLTLTPKEFDLLATLCGFPGVVLGREQLLDLVWGTSFYAVRTVDVHIARLREKLGGSNVHIDTVWGTGYRLTPPGGP
ncbi:MAG: response regulator transcription factor [Dehalococcoidia bacterium]|nr:response regulator transcription factor [Dehalococcoidia bacterium]